MKHSFYQIVISLLFLLMGALSSQAEIKATLTLQPSDLLICEVGKDPIALFIPLDNETNNATGSFTANVIIDFQDKEEVPIHKITYQWTTEGLDIKNETKKTCDISVSELEQWGILYHLTCKVKIIKGGETITLTKQYKIAPARLLITEVHFNHNQNDYTQDAANLNTSFARELINAPEFKPRSQRPFLYIGSITPTIKAKITLLPNILKNGRVEIVQDTRKVGPAPRDLIGPLNPENFTSDKLTTFTAQQPLPNKVTKKKQAWVWHLTHIEGTKLPPKRISYYVCTGLGYITLKDGLLEPWSQINPLKYPWIDVLNFTFDSCLTTELGSPEKIIEHITTYLYTKHNVIYNLNNGSPPGYSGFETNQNAVCSLALHHYMKKTDETKVNCMDQATALVLLSRLLGIKTQQHCISGFMPLLNTIQIVGQPNRPETVFGQHQLCSYKFEWSDATLGLFNTKQNKFLPIMLCPHKNYIEGIVDPQVPLIDARFPINYNPQPIIFTTHFH